jgi:hypothetical protein
MRATFLLQAILLLLCQSALSGETFPYKVEVADETSRIFSGPGEQFYTTGYVERGEEVEVFKRKAGGWLAIRPPQDSFSWVAAKQLRETDDPQIARVVGNNVVAWVGSELGSVQDHKWQVKLDPGETVKVIGKSTFSIFGRDGRREFCQITPPAGEFRWIREREVQPLVPQGSAIESNTEVQLAEFQIDESSTETTAPRDGFIPRSQAAGTADGERVASLAPRKSLVPEAVSPADVEASLKDLDVELSLMAAQPPEQWKFTSLRRQTESLIDRSTTTLQRGQTRRLLEKINEFERLQQGYAGLEKMRGLEQPAAPRRPDAPRERESLNSFNPRFDGRGWLLPVQSTKRAAPPYALLDAEGKILLYVSPAPGLNLHRYLRKPVGIFGQRSRATFFEKPHLTADRIVDLQRHRR